MRPPQHTDDKRMRSAVVVTFMDFDLAATRRRHRLATSNDDECSGGDVGCIGRAAPGK